MISAALAGLALVWLLARPALTPLGFPLDDAWIHLVYARSFAMDFSLAYNVGEPSTGCTSPLWAALLGVGQLLIRPDSDAAAIRLSLVLGAGLHVLCAVAVARIAARLGDAFAALVAGVTVALCPQLCAAALSGMEVPLTALLLLLGIQALLDARWIQAGVWLGLAPLARPEAALASTVAVLWTLFARTQMDRKQRVNQLMSLAIPALLGASWLLLRDFRLTGHALPATFYAKAQLALDGLPLRLMRSLTRNVASVPPLWAGLGWLALPGLWRADRRYALPLWAGLAFLVASAIATDPGDPNAFYFLRYQLPAIPLLTLSLVLGAPGLGQQIPTRFQRLPLVLFATVAVAGMAVKVHNVSWRLANDTRNVDDVQANAGRWLAENTPPDARVASVDSGAVRYLSGRWTLDLLGLNSPEMLWHRDNFARMHPVDVLVWMPNAMRLPPDAPLHDVWRQRTSPYTVLNAPEMATQAIASCSATSQQPIRLSGYFPTQFWCRRR